MIPYSITKDFFVFTSFCISFLYCSLISSDSIKEIKNRKYIEDLKKYPELIDKIKKKILGRPLYSWVLGEAIRSKPDEVYVFTDDEQMVSSIDNNYAWR